MFINPDEPKVGGSINQYVIPQRPANSNYYYNGYGYGYYGQPTQNPFDSISGFGSMSQQNTETRRNVNTQYAPYTGSYVAPDPFASMTNNCGLNSFVESRRDFNNTNTSVGNNPWAQSSAMNQPMNNYCQQQTSYLQNDPFNPYNTVSSMIPVETNFSKKDGYWVNQYTEPQRLTPPTIDWYHDSNQSFSTIAPPNMGYQQFPQMTEQTWNDIAKANWNS